MWTENSGCWQNFVKVLKLLASTLLVRVWDGFVVDVGNVREAVNDESTHHASLSHLVFLDVDGGQVGQCLKFRDLDEGVDIVVHEEQSLEFAESAQFADVSWWDYIVESNVLKANLLHCLLEVCVVQHFKSIAVNEQFVVAFDLGVARLHKALASWLLPALVPIQT